MILDGQLDAAVGCGGETFNVALFDVTAGRRLVHAVRAPIDTRNHRHYLELHLLAQPNRRYELVALLGRGGMGDVYLARRDDPEVEHEVAIKLLRTSSASAEALSRFRIHHRRLYIETVRDFGRSPVGRPGVRPVDKP